MFFVNTVWNTIVSKILLDGEHRVWWGSYADVEPPEKKAGFIVTDPPPIPQETGVGAYWIQTSEMFGRLERWADRETILVLIPRDAKGMHFAKSTVLATCACSHEWELYRQYCWFRADADYHRAHSAWSPVYCFRKAGSSVSGDRKAPLFYRDVVRVKDTVWSQGGSEIAPFPQELLTAFFGLFRFQTGYAFDPYAGSGAVALAAQAFGIPSVSVEIDYQRAQQIVIRLENIRLGNV